MRKHDVDCTVGIGAVSRRTPFASVLRSKIVGTALTPRVVVGEGYERLKDQELRPGLARQPHQQVGMAAEPDTLEAQVRPGRRLVPRWGRIGDIFHWLCALAVLALVLLTLLPADDASIRVAEKAGFPQVVTCDGGGTSRAATSCGARSRTRRRWSASSSRSSPPRASARAPGWGSTCRGAWWSAATAATSGWCRSPARSRSRPVRRLTTCSG